MPSPQKWDLEYQNSTSKWSEFLTLKHGNTSGWGWGPRLRARFGYRTPNDWYEALLFETVQPDTSWLDVGCGRFLLPSNHPLANLLASRCRLLVGLDPDDNIDENPYIHRRAKCHIEDFASDMQFDLITLRMVAEHIQNPEKLVEQLFRLAKPGGRIVIYTVSKWSPVSLVAAATPISVHHGVKRLLWRTSERDTFPTEYKMNTRRALHRLFVSAGFDEESFRYLDDCRSLQRWKMLNVMELSFWKLLHSVGLHYPELCILATYRKMPTCGHVENIVEEKA
jgi:SAM-dependent methyltransferase